MLVAGTDEVGYGALAGPIIAVTVLLDVPAKKDTLHSWWPLGDVNDSKQLTKKKREALREQLPQFIIDNNGSVGIGWVDTPLIDGSGYSKAWMTAISESVRQVTSEANPDLLIVDGTRPLNNYVGPQIAVAKADSMYFNVAAASIIAKLLRDEFMEFLAEAYPVYGWDRNSGYGTKEHKQALITHGLTKHHREKPCRTILG
jgi:ribonuclease HII